MLPLILLSLPAHASPPEPAAPVEPFVIEAPGGSRADPYYWMRDREDPRTVEYLEAENAWAEYVLARFAALEDTLYREMRARMPEADSTFPAPFNGFLYWSRYDPGSSYPVYLRRPAGGAGAVATVLDVNDLAAGRDYIDAWPVVSPDGSLAGIAFDTTGSLDYTIVFRDLETGGYLADTLRGTDGSIVWAADSRTVFFGLQDSTLRTDRIMRHELGAPGVGDAEVFREADPTFWPWVYGSPSGEYVFIETSSSTSSEVMFIPSEEPLSEPVVIQPRTPGVEYRATALGDSIFVLTNWGASNFRIMRASPGSPGMEEWVEVVPGRDGILIEDFDVFPGFLAMLVRNGGFSELRVLGRIDGAESVVAGGEEPCTIWLGPNREPSLDVCRFGYSSPTTPHSTLEYAPGDDAPALLLMDPVGGGFDASLYTAGRLLVRSHDGVEVPMSIVYRSDLGPPLDRPVLLYGYGAYGYSTDPWFSGSRISLLDRGFICAIAHVRGGSEMGRGWYESGRLLQKRNSFLDFIACARYLVEGGYTDPGRLFAMGESAGGLLVGAVANMEPGLFRGIIAGVPFVDVVTTMLDPGIPLTTNEYEEWGNPADPGFYEYMLSYSPYDNVRPADYPALFVFAGWNDFQVGYWEPAKWVARIRATRTDDDPLVLLTDMGAGHAGASGRFGHLSMTAREYAFIIGLLE